MTEAGAEVTRRQPDAREVIDRTAIDSQRAHWTATFRDHPDMYGTSESEPARAALALFAEHGVVDVVELGAGQGRDTLAFLSAGHRVTALDYSANALSSIAARARGAARGDRLRTVVHDVRKALPLPDASADAVYSHMLLNMALTDDELVALAAEIRRVLRPGGWHVYTVRHIGDPHHGTGIPRGEDMSEQGGFIVHFFDEPLVERLGVGFAPPEIVPFEEGDLPRRLWRITQRREAAPA